MRHDNCRWAWISVLLVSLSCFAQTLVHPQELAPAKPIEREQDLSSPQEAKALIEQGERALTTGDRAQALTAFGRAKDIAERAGDQVVLAYALGKLGDVLRLQGNYVEALRHLQKSIALSETAGDKKRLAWALNNAGSVYLAQGEMRLLLEHSEKSLALSEEVGDKVEIARSLNGLGAYYRSQSDLTQALSYYQRALKINEELGNKSRIAILLGNIGNAHMAQGDYSQSFHFFKRSLELRREMKDDRGIAYMLMFLGINHRALGDEEQALEHFQKSLALYERFNDKSGVAFALEYVGVSLLNWKGDQPGAELRFQKSLELYESLGEKHGVARILSWLGRVYYEKGDYAQTLVSHLRSLKLYEEIGDKAGITDILIHISNAYRANSEPQKALEYAARATALARQTNVQRFVADARVAEGKAYQALKRNEAAREAFADAIAAVEVSRSRIAGNTTRASYFTTVREPYELYVDLLMRMHKEHPSAEHDHLAFQMSERGRSRTLLEALSEARGEIRQGVDPTLLKQEQALHSQLNSAGERQTRLLSGKHTADQALATKKEIAALTAEFQEVEAQIMRRSPRYAALTQPTPLNVKEIQALLDADTLLLEFALGEERSFLWAVTPTSINSFELPKRSEIETEVRRAVSLLSDGKQWTTSDQIESEYAEVAGRLSRILLHPVAAQLKGKRLLIVADGALQYLPFGALPSPKSGTSKDAPLIADFEIVNLPSASTLAILRRETANRARPANGIAVLADPVFEETDQRVPAAISQGKSGATTSVSSVSRVRDAALTESRDSRAILERAFRVESTANGDGVKREVLKISRLPFTRFEAEGILASAPRTQSFKATDFRASRETATSAELSKYRFIHFATHGILNTEHPELSGLVLSLVNEKGEPVDGFLRLHDIYNLNLPADLVVLSACQTGLGKEIRGEGLVGLTRGFMYAGAPRVVASLWKVDDTATAELMKRFYRGMLKEKLRPAAALRLAKIEMWKQKRWNAPFYWAAFELQGEWR